MPPHNEQERAVIRMLYAMGVRLRYKYTYPGASGAWFDMTRTATYPVFHDSWFEGTYYERDDDGAT